MEQVAFGAGFGQLGGPVGLCWGWWAVPRRCCEAAFWQGYEAAFWQGCEAAFWQGCEAAFWQGCEAAFWQGCEAALWQEFEAAFWQGCEAAFWQDCEAAFWQDCEAAFWQDCEAAFWQDCGAAFWQDCEAAFWQGGEAALWQGSETEVAIWRGWWEGFLEEHSCRTFWLFLHRRWPFFWDIFCCPSGDQIGTVWCWLLQLVPCPPAVRILGTGCCFYGGCGTGSFSGGSIRILCAISGSLFRSGMFMGTGFSGTGLPFGVVGGFGFWPCPWSLPSAFPWLAWWVRCPRPFPSLQSVTGRWPCSPGPSLWWRWAYSSGPPFVPVLWGGSLSPWGAALVTSRGGWCSFLIPSGFGCSMGAVVLPLSSDQGHRALTCPILEDGWRTEGAQWGTVNDRTSVGGGQGTETEGVVDRVLKARAGMKGGRGEEGVGGMG